MAALGVSYARESDRITAAGVLVDMASDKVIDEAMVEGTAAFPCTSGLLACGEVPILLRGLLQPPVITDTEGRLDPVARHAAPIGDSECRGPDVLCP